MEPLSRSSFDHPRAVTRDNSIHVIVKTNDSNVFLRVPLWHYELLSDIYAMGLKDPNAILEDPEGPISFSWLQTHWARHRFEVGAASMPRCLNELMVSFIGPVAEIEHV